MTLQSSCVDESSTPEEDSEQQIPRKAPSLSDSFGLQSYHRTLVQSRAISCNLVHRQPSLPRPSRTGGWSRDVAVSQVQDGPHPLTRCDCDCCDGHCISALRGVRNQRAWPWVQNENLEPSACIIFYHLFSAFGVQVNFNGWGLMKQPTNFVGKT